MNRPIKFRAWWIEKKKMLHNVHDFYDTLCNESHGNEYEPESSFGSLLDKPDEYCVMQYTGLKDKNGKEIYEGDILKANVKNAVLWKCEFDEGAFKFRRVNFESEGLYGYYPGLEVIGNIYENPELLEATK